MKKLIFLLFISSFLISQSLTKGWYNDSFDVPDTLWVKGIQIFGSSPPGAGKVLTSDGGGVGTWQAAVGGFADPMTTRGDIIYRNASNVTARFGLGANKFVLQSDGTDLTWSEFLASEMNIVDAGAKITATEVEGALQENRTAIDLNTAKVTNTDDQKIDVFSISGNNVQLSLESDGEATKTVDISSTTAVSANTSLLNVTPGTATASKALVVDASKDIDLGTGDFDANIGVFDGTLITNSNFVMEGYSTGRNILRYTTIIFEPGFTANTNIKTTSSGAFNKPSITDAVATNDATSLGKNETEGNWILNSAGDQLRLDLTETVIEVLSLSISVMDLNSSSATYYVLDAFENAGNILFLAKTLGSQTNIDWTTILDAGDLVQFKIAYITST